MGRPRYRLWDSRRPGRRVTAGSLDEPLRRYLRLSCEASHGTPPGRNCYPFGRDLQSVHRRAGRATAPADGHWRGPCAGSPPHPRCFIGITVETWNPAVGSRTRNDPRRRRPEVVTEFVQLGGSHARTTICIDKKDPVAVGPLVPIGPDCSTPTIRPRPPRPHPEPWFMLGGFPVLPWKARSMEPQCFSCSPDPSPHAWCLQG